MNDEAMQLTRDLSFDELAEAYVELRSRPTREETLEECARIAEQSCHKTGTYSAIYIAQRIRSLRGGADRTSAAILSSDLGEGMGIRSDSIQKANIDADR